MDNHEDKSIPNGDIVDAVVNKVKTKQRTSWSVLACLTAILIVIILNQTGALRNISTTRGINVQKRDLSTPSSRLVGHWVADFWGSENYYRPINVQIGVGTYVLVNSAGCELVEFKILSEDSTGTELVVREFLLSGSYAKILGPRFSIDAKYHLAKDGKSMSKEISCGQKHELIVYSYVDDKTCP